MPVNWSSWRFVANACMLLTVGSAIPGAYAQTHSYEPPDGVIPNETVALDIAKVYLTTVYGKAQIESELPLVASLKDKVWTVRGSFKKKYSVGGVAEIDLSQQDGRVLRLTHSM